jgi:hypothetical protein
VLDFTVVDIATGLGHFEPPHVANRLARPRQGIVDCLLHSVWRRANDLNFLVNVFSHARIVCRTSGENNKNPSVPANRTRQLLNTEFALQTNTRSASLALCEPRLQSGSC